jgi:exopolysaccharide biosynthesis protein
LYGIAPASKRSLKLDSSGTPRISHAPDAAKTAATWAFQSYPTLLRSGEVPTELRGESTAIDLEHRDARAAIGVDANGRVIIPFGLTTPEMAAVMGALGARDAVMLDGGISGQMLIRDGDGTKHTWRGARAVPLALIAEPRR